MPIRLRRVDAMLRLVLNGAVIGAALSTVSIVRQTIRGPRDWRLALGWASWGIGVALAVGAVVDQAREAKELAAADDGR